jgi:hypothetical protein
VNILDNYIDDLTDEEKEELKQIIDPCNFDNIEGKEEIDKRNK